MLVGDVFRFWGSCIRAWFDHMTLSMCLQVDWIESLQQQVRHDEGLSIPDLSLRHDDIYVMSLMEG